MTVWSRLCSAVAALLSTYLHSHLIGLSADVMIQSVMTLSSVVIDEIPGIFDGLHFGKNR